MRVAAACQRGAPWPMGPPCSHGSDVGRCATLSLPPPLPPGPLQAPCSSTSASRRRGLRTGTGTTSRPAHRCVRAWGRPQEGGCTGAGGREDDCPNRRPSLPPSPEQRPETGKTVLSRLLKGSGSAAAFSPRDGGAGTPPPQPSSGGLLSPAGWRRGPAATDAASAVSPRSPPAAAPALPPPPSYSSGDAPRGGGLFADRSGGAAAAAGAAVSPRYEPAPAPAPRAGGATAAYLSAPAPAPPSAGAAASAPAAAGPGGSVYERLGAPPAAPGLGSAPPPPPPPAAASSATAGGRPQSSYELYGLAFPPTVAPVQQQQGAYGY